MDSTWKRTTDVRVSSWRKKFLFNHIQFPDAMMTVLHSLAAALFAISRTGRSSNCHTQLHVVPLTPSIVPKEKYDSLLDWLRSQECEVSDKIYFDESSRGGGYGAFVNGAFEEGDILFTVPRTACVTLDDVKADESCGKTFSAIMEKAGPGGNTVCLAGYLAKEYLISLESMEESKFGPYLQTLPWERGTNYQEHILFWKDADVEKDLGGSFCYGEANELRSEVGLAIKVLDGVVGRPIRVARGEIEENGGFRLPWVKEEKPEGPVEGLPQAIKGAFVSILTRAFQDGDDEEEKLVPILDMLQHSDEPNISHAMRTADGTVEVRARRAIEAGEELLNQYRSEEDENMPYHRFFTRFGFVPGIQEPVEDLLDDKSSIFYPKVVEV